uniref:Uncharacterized protein n=1 Tax=Terrapene triunguis TaxID=2587831 RepID=A0A674J9J9_9SAUR
RREGWAGAACLPQSLKACSLPRTLCQSIKDKGNRACHRQINSSHPTRPWERSSNSCQAEGAATGLRCICGAGGGAQPWRKRGRVCAGQDPISKAGWGNHCLWMLSVPSLPLASMTVSET